MKMDEITTPVALPADLTTTQLPQVAPGNLWNISKSTEPDAFLEFSPLERYNLYTRTRSSMDRALRQACTEWTSSGAEMEIEVLRTGV